MRQGLWLLTVVGFVTVFAACGDSASGSPGEGGNPQEVRITLSEYEIKSSQSTFEAGVPYRLVIENAGQGDHELMIMPRGITEHHAALLEVHADQLPPGTEVTREFTFTEAGEFEFACHLTGHYDAGMILPITVE